MCLHVHTHEHIHIHTGETARTRPPPEPHGVPGINQRMSRCPASLLSHFLGNMKGGGQFTTTEVTSLLKDGSKEMRTLHPKSLGPCHFKFIVFLAWTHIHVLGGAQSGCFNEADVWVIPIWGLYHLWFSTSATGFGVLLGGEVGLWPCFT